MKTNTHSIDMLSAEQRKIISCLYEHELPLTAEQLVDKFGLRASYVSSALSSLADRGYLIRVGKTLPINGRAGHILWTVSKEVSRNMPPRKNTLIVVNNQDEDKNSEIMERVLITLRHAKAPLSALSLKMVTGTNMDITIAIMTAMVKSGKAVRVGKAHWVATETLDALKAEDMKNDGEIPVSKRNSESNLSKTLRDTLAHNGRAVRTMELAELLGRTYQDISTRLNQMAENGKIVKTQTVGADGRQIYWSTPENAPTAVRAF